MAASPFLTAEWRSLVALNYAIDPAVVAPLVPSGVELDLWQGEALVSIVGFLFLDTRLLGVPVPGHRDFEEVNLRFYVRRRVGDEIRRGVTFIREIVPRWAIAAMARAVYNEPYLSLPMRHQNKDWSYEFAWKFRDRWHSLGVEAIGESAAMAAGSEEEFIFEHYWGYTRQRDGGTIEYQVEHPRWDVRQVERAWFDGDVAELYGPQFVPTLTAAPRSAFLATGSPVAVLRGQRIPREAPTVTPEF